MRHARILLSVITLSSLLGLTPAGLAQSLTFTNFTSLDPLLPGASTTFANGIRSAGSTTSVPYSAQGAENGVRNQFGEEQHQDATTFPGQGNGLGQDKHQGTGSTGSTGSTQVVGFYTDAMGLPHSYLLTYLSTGTTRNDINATGAMLLVPTTPALGTWTFATGVNSAGQIVGYYMDSANQTHGFVQTGGTTTSFDAPGAVYGTFPTGISGGGKIAGSYSDNKGTHAFVRAGTGTTASTITFDAPGASALYGSYATGVNDTTGQVVGYYYDSVPSVHGFICSGSCSGSTTFTPIVFSGAFDIWATAINSSGQIAGYFLDSSGRRHGYLRSTTGGITQPIDFPAPPGTTIIGTTINGLNDSGQIVGEYFDSANQQHGYKSP